MDIDKVGRTYTKLVDRMEADNFGRVSCMAIKPMVRKMIEHKGEYSSYSEFFEKFIDREGINGNTKRLRYYRTTVRHIWAFDEFGHYPDRLKFAPVLNQDSSYKILNDYYRSIVDEYVIMAENRLLSAKTIYVDKNIVSCFFAEMQKKGALTIDEITPQMTINFFIEDGKYIRGNDNGAKLKKVLNNFKMKYPHIGEILKFVPKRKDVVVLHDIIPDSEIKAAKDAVADESFEMLLRDRAIIAIALYTGMRGSDIANMSIENIDWANDRISLIQSKTHVQLVLPLSSAVGNALYDYIAKEWQKREESTKLFFNEHKKDKPLTQESIGCIIERFFTRLGFKVKGKQRRLRVLRHYLASKLLNIGAEPAVISSILGHTNPESVNNYYDEDIENLRKCALDVSMFPIDEEVFK